MLMKPEHRTHLQALARKSFPRAEQAGLLGLVMAALQHSYTGAVDEIDKLIDEKIAAKCWDTDFITLKYFRADVFQFVPFKVEICNKIVNGRAVGNLYGVGRWVDGRRTGWVLEPQASKARARDFAMRANKDPGDFVEKWEE